MYKTTTNFFGQTVIIRTNTDGSTTSFFEEQDNTDYQEYLEWVADGGVPEEADD